MKTRIYFPRTWGRASIAVLIVAAAAACGGADFGGIEIGPPLGDEGADATTGGDPRGADGAVSPPLDANAPEPDAGTGGGGQGDASDAAIDAPPPPKAGADATVVGFDKKRIYYAGNEANRTADATAAFPAAGSYSSITLHLALDCPQGGCDAYDRLGSIAVVQKGAAPGGADLVVELSRFITPFGVAGSWDVDITPLRPLLSGSVTLRAFIDTWVPQQGVSAGNGWLLSASFVMKGGVSQHDPIAVVPVWPRTYAVYGDPARPIPSSVPPRSVDLKSLANAGATTYSLRSFVTGHGEGGNDNCAELCSRQHTLTIGSTPHAISIWRTDCATTATPAQNGAWQTSRAGWCAGAAVNAWTLDATADLAGSTTASFAYDVQSWVNACRPTDAGTCPGCNAGKSGCAYDGSNHTEPAYYVSSVLIAAR